MTQQATTHGTVEAWLARSLNAGVALAACLVVAGLGMHLARHAGEGAGFSAFVPSDLDSAMGVLKAAGALKPAGVVQLGVLVLIATPVARVVTAGVLFALRRDALYTVLSCVVLAGLALGLWGIIE